MTKPSVYHSQGYTCADLKKNKISCAEIIDFSYDSLNEVLDK